jgi:hypothetical protein
MSDIQLKTPARQALIALVLFVEEATNPVLHERFGLKIDKATREQLVEAELVTLGKGLNRATTHELTEKGWKRGRAELAAMAPAFAGNAGPAWGRLLYGALNVLDRLMTEKKLQMAHVFTVPEATAVAEQETEPDSGEEELSVSVEDRVLATYDELAELPGDLVSLARLRGKLVDVSRADLDRVLKAMDRARIIQLDPDPNRKALPPEAREAAINIGGEDKHLLTIVRR